MTDALTPDAFVAWARALGLRASADHLALLRPEVRALLERIGPLEDIDLSSVPIERAFGDAG